MSDLINDQMDRIKVIKSKSTEAEICEKEIERLKRVCKDYAGICASYQRDRERYMKRIAELENGRP